MSENQQNRDSSEGGLFSEDYEAPKRENPYLKKNREKAKPEKSPKPEKAPKPEKVTPAAVEEEQASAPLSEEDAPARRRGFSDWIFEHVKLIAAIGTILVVLSLVLIIDVVGVVQDLVFQIQQENREELTLTYVQGLSEKSSPITWGDLDAFRRDETNADDSITWMIPVKGGRYEVWISGTSISNRPSYVYLFDMKTGKRMILGEDDLEAFIGSQS